jgi:hypothetical protein
MRKINQYKRTYYKEVGALIGFMFGTLLAITPGYETYTAEPQVIATTTPVVKKQLTIEDKIRSHFPKSHKTIIAIAHAESGMNNNAIGYNCYYNSDETIVYETKVKGSHSRACQPNHRKYSWSVDCFLLQKNYPGRKTCPKDVTLDQHLKEVAELSRVQGLSAWTSYTNGSYLTYK